MKIILVVLLILFPFISFSFQRSDAQREIEVKAYLDSALQANDPLEIAEAWYRMAKIEASKLNILESNRNLYKSIRILEKHEPSYELGRNYYWLAINTSGFNKNEQLKHLEKALSIHTAANSDRGMMLCYGALSGRYGQYLNFTTADEDYIPDYEKALYYLNLSLKYAKKIHDKEAIHSLLSDEKRIKELMNGGENKHFVEANPEIIEENPERHDVIQSKLDYASFLIKKNNIEEAIKWIKESEKVIARLYKNNYSLLRLLNKAYYEYYKKIQNSPLALKHLEKYHEFHTKVLLEDREGAISNLHILHETEKKENELSQQALEIELQDRNLILTQRLLSVSGVFLLILGILAIILYRLNKKNKAISNRNALLVKEQNHRVKNNLQIVSSLLNIQANSLADENSIAAMEEAQLRIASMVHLHRQLYDTENIDKIDMLRFVTEITEDVLNSYSLNHTETIIHIDEVYIEADKAVLLGLLINELVTNSCKYALKDHSSPKLSISLVKFQLDNLELVVKDNGVEKVNLTERNQKSFGSKLIAMMVSQLDGISNYNYYEGLEFKLTFNT